MSKVEWTGPQRAAIVDRGGSLLLSAAAGSGKTAVLVERVVGLLTDPVRPVEADRLLIVTFTNAAAAELRARIYKRLSDCLRDDPGNHQLRRQRMLLQRASICTIDAYCLHLLQTHFSALDIPPDFTTIDAGACRRLQEECLQQVLERAYEKPEFRAFADLYGRGRSDEKAGSVVLELYSFLRSLPDPHETLEKFCQMWEQDKPFAKDVWWQVLSGVAVSRLQSALALALEAKKAAEESMVAAEKYGPVFSEDVTQIERLLRSLREQDGWELLYHDVRAVEWGRIPAIRGGKDPEAEMAAELRKEYKKLVDTLADDVFICSSKDYLEDRRAAAPLVRALAQTVLDFEQTFYQAKLEEKQLEFSDFEHLTLRLLRAEDGGPTPLARQIAGGISAVMVDEYQDSNALQDAIYHLLASPQKDNLFFVGDLKQSIYRFRQADPRIFLEKQDRFAPLGQGYPAQIALDSNFRSAPGVIDAVNYFFGLLMSRQLGGIDYGPGQQLKAGADTGGFAGEFRMQLIQTDEAEGEAAQIAAQIKDWLAQGVPVRGSEGLRPCQQGDFCILLRSRAHFGVYAQALQAQGLQVYADVAENLLDAPSVRPFAALLRVLDNPAQDVCLAAVMLSPLFGFVPDDLVRLRADGEKGSLYGALLRTEDKAMQDFYKTLAAMRRQARSQPVDSLIEGLLAQTGYLAAVGAMPDGPRRRDQLRAFAHWAAEAGRGGLPALIRAMDYAAQADGVSAGTAQTRPDCVSIMTIHRSKGLEFPVVFVAGLSHKFNLRDVYSPVLFHSQLGLGLNLRGKNGNNYTTLAHQALRFQLQRESLSEEMRILYVALTRARDRLVLSVSLADPAKTLQKLAPYAQSDDALQYRLFTAADSGVWLLLAALRHPQAVALRALAAMPSVEGAVGPQDMVFEVVQPPESRQQEIAPHDQPTAAPDPALLGQLRENFAWRYPGGLLRDIPAKVSVTGLTHGQAEASLERPAFEYAGGLTGAEKGTALHSFMQNADFRLASRDPAAEAERQKRLQLLDPALYEQIDLAALRAFFDGPVFARIRAAKRVLREYDFITSVPASAVMGDKQADYGEARVLVQGVADLVLVFDDHVELVDYKTDRGKTPDQLREQYAPQLWLYRAAVQQRLGLPVTRCTLYSFALNAEVEVPLL